MDVRQEYLRWKEACRENEELYDELSEMANDEESINDAFYCELAFGTGGLRGIIGAGTNRMNIYTVGRATRGLAKYLLATAEKPSVVIAYDSRHKSAEFARLAAEIFSENGVKAYLFSELTPTPVLSFAVRYLRATAGIVITASHNPKAYNGYKVYNEKGCQITEAAAKAITERIRAAAYFEKITPNAALIEVLDDGVLQAFLAEIQKYALFSEVGKYAPKIVYTPLNGTGNKPVREILRRVGAQEVLVVPEQEQPNGDFPTCPYPNPEERAALSKALELAKKEGAELVLATDPDADRVGIAVRRSDGEYRLFNGNETGVLMEDYLLRAKKESGGLRPCATVVKTIVTSDMATDVAKAYGAEVKEVLTGFKYIGETIDTLETPEDYVFGMEESYGYLVGAHASDKDAVSAAMTIVEMAAYYAAQGKTLIDVLESLYAEYGYYKTRLLSKTYLGEKGKAQMGAFTAALRAEPWTNICGETCRVKDYVNGLDGLPKSNVLSFIGERLKIIVRPSGTEPKIKFYLTAKRDTEAASDELLSEAEKFVERWTK